MLKRLWKNKILLILLLLLLWLVPVTISVPEQSSTECIITAIAVDKVQDEYEVTLQYIKPAEATATESLTTVTGKDKSVHRAIEKLNAQIGKFSGIAHCRAIVFSEESCQNGLSEILDNFIRQKTNSNNMLLICSTKKAKDVLTTAKNLDGDLYSFLNNSAFSNELKDYEDLVTVGDFYETFFGPNNAIKLRVIDTKKQEEEGSSNSGGNIGASSTSSGDSGSSGSSGGTGGNTSLQSELLNEGKSIILKHSKPLVVLSPEESENLNWFNNGIKKTSFIIENFSDENFKNANFLFDVYNKKLQTNVYFKDGKPHYDLKVKLYIRTSEITKENLTQQDYEAQQQKFSNKLFDTIKQTIEQKLKLAESNFKQNKYDVIKCEEAFYKFKNSEYKKYKQTLSHDKEFIEDVIFNYSIEVAKGF